MNRVKGLFELIQLNPWRNNHCEESARDTGRDTGTNERKIGIRAIT